MFIIHNGQCTNNFMYDTIKNVNEVHLRYNEEASTLTIKLELADRTIDEYVIEVYE